MPNDLTESILKNATGPKSAEVDGQSVEQHSLKDLIAVDKYLEGKKAMRSKSNGLKFTKLNHSGA